MKQYAPFKPGDLVKFRGEDHKECLLVISPYDCGWNHSSEHVSILYNRKKYCGGWETVTRCYHPDWLEPYAATEKA